MLGKVCGQYREGEVMTTIKDIARLSGYSIGTVSRVINNRADVSEEAREKISEVIREHDYQPNSNARKLKQVISSEVKYDPILFKRFHGAHDLVVLSLFTVIGNVSPEDADPGVPL